jgi:NAD(P)H-dependent FMN reductase
LALSGSSRQGSLNQGVLAVASAAARTAGAEVETLDLRELGLPVFDQDLEAAEGLPAGAKRLKAAMKRAQGLLIASPEYNSLVTPLLLNALDWASRPEPGEPMLAAFAGKAAGLVAASPGALGGLRGLFALRAMLQNAGVLVLPDMAAVGGLDAGAFPAPGKLADARKQAMVEKVGAGLAALARKLAAA